MTRPACVVLALACALGSAPARGDETPTRWEQLFFPFPIVGAPPQLEQQVQLFANVFTGAQGGGVQAAAELGYIVSPHFGLVATVPYQFGFSGQRWGFGDVELLAQYLAGGSLALDDMVSIGIEVSLPTAQNQLGAGDLLVGGFAYAAQRLWHRLILELNVTALLPVLHGSTTRQFPINGLLSLLVTPLRFSVPIYLQGEVDTTTYVVGTTSLPPGATEAPAITVAIAPELFVGPWKGMRFCAGVFFNVAGDPIHAVTYSVTAAFDLPNRFGY